MSGEARETGASINSSGRENACRCLLAASTRSLSLPPPPLMPATIAATTTFRFPVVMLSLYLLFFFIFLKVMFIEQRFKGRSASRDTLPGIFHQCQVSHYLLYPQIERLLITYTFSSQSLRNSMPSKPPTRKLSLGVCLLPFPSCAHSVPLPSPHFSFPKKTSPPLTNDSSS